MTQVQLTSDFGPFEAGRICNIVPSPYEKVQLIDHNEDPSVPEIESNVTEFDYWVQPVLASNESAALRGTKIPVMKSEIKFLGGTMDIDRQEIFEITRDVNLYMTGHETDVVKFHEHTKRSAVLKEQNPQQFEAIREEIIDLVQGFNIHTEQKANAIIDELGLPKAISDWSIEQVENYIAKAKEDEYPELIVGAILNIDTTRHLFNAIEKAFLDAK